MWGGLSNVEVAVRGAAELVGTMLLVAIGCMGCLPGWESGAPLHMQSALTFGFTLMCVAQIGAHISGAHVDPVITLASVIFGSTTLPVAAVYVVSQMVGGIAGYGLLLVVTPESALGVNGTHNFCVTIPNPSLTSGQAVLLEAFITGVLILFCCSLWDPCNAKNCDSTPIKFGLLVAGIAMATGSFTGPSMNPARSFGPALFTGNWERHWVYWVGPTLGSVIAAFLYCYVFLKKSVPVVRKYEELPLNEVKKESDQGV